MDTLDCIRTRPAVRGFLPDPIPPAVVRTILEAGQQAHSQRNRQPWRFIVIQDKQTLAQLGALGLVRAFSGPGAAGDCCRCRGRQEPTGRRHPGGRMPDAGRLE